MSALIVVNAFFFSCIGYRTGDRRRTDGSKDKNKDSTGISPLHPYISMHILCTVFSTLPGMLTRGICFYSGEIVSCSSIEHKQRS